MDKPVEHFIRFVHVKEVDAESITEPLEESHIVISDEQEEQLSCVFIVRTYQVLLILFHLDLGPATFFSILILGTYQTSNADINFCSKIFCCLKSEV